MFEPNNDSITQIDNIWKEIFNFRPKVVFEFGARYGEDSLALASVFKEAKIYSFECNPNTLESCSIAVLANSQIKLIPCAVGNHDGEVKFYPINKEKTITTWPDGNQGASSLFKASGKYPVEKYIQDEVVVPIIKASTFMALEKIDSIDILWMDIQGAELLALKGFDDLLQNVKVIFTEVEFFEIYSNQPRFEDIRRFLKQNNFYFWNLINAGEFAGDALFINKEYLTESIMEHNDLQLHKALKSESFISKFKNKINNLLKTRK